MKITLWQKLAAAGCVTAGTLVAGPPAAAADGHAPFSQDAAVALIARPDGSGAEQLYAQRLAPEADGAVTKVGIPWQGNGSTREYNAMGFNAADGYAYALAGGFSDGGDHNLLQIGSDGSVVDLGALRGELPGAEEFVNNGTIVDGRNLLVSAFDGRTLWSIDLQTRAVRATTLSSVWMPADFVSIGDPNVLWGVEDVRAYRLDVRTGVVDTFAAPISPFVGGAIFAHPDGELGLSADDGEITRVRIDDASSATPRFTVLSSSRGPASATADGAAIGENADVQPPFDKNKPLGLWAASLPGAARLYAIDVTADDAPSAPLGHPWGGNGRVNAYNAMGFNKADGYVYAITGAFYARDNRLVKIGSDGTVTEVGRLTGPGGADNRFLNAGAVVDGRLLVSGNGGRWLLSVDLATADYTQIPTSGWNVADFTTNDGVYLWGVAVGTGEFQRMEIATGTVTGFPNTIIPAAVDAGGIVNGTGGDFIVSTNATDGKVYRFHVTDPASNAPTFSLVGSGTGPGDGENDGTSTVDAQ